MSALPPIEEIILLKTDAWGEAAIAQENGPDYAFFERLLPPLRYVNTTFRHYPIVLGAPGGLCKARFVSNGSGVNLSAEGAHGWNDVGFPVTLRVGPREALFGAALRQLDGPRYLDGCLPVVRLSYRDTGCRYAQEAFAPLDPILAAHGAVLLKFSLTEGAQGDLTAHVRWKGSLTFRENGLCDEQGRQLIWLDGTWQWDPLWNFLKAPLTPEKPVYMIVFTDPLPHPEPSPLNAEACERLRRACIAGWNGLLEGGADIRVPEDAVNNAWRALIIANHTMLRDDQMCYSAHNQYEKIYVAEGGDAIRSLLLYGHEAVARRAIPPILSYQRPGLEYHQAGFKLQLLTHHFHLTRDADFLRAQRERWMPEIRRILEHREPESGLFPRERYCGDVATQVYSLNANANAWRGLRDGAATLAGIGERAEAEHLSGIAAEFREKILTAVEKSERRDVDPPFIPLALFGEEEPYDVLTANKAGSYWDLMAPYILNSGVFGSDRSKGMIAYLQQHGGVCMGMIRSRPNMEFWVNKSNVVNLYGLRYTLELLRNDDVDRALVSFYGKLAQGMTRDTFIDGEASCLVPMDGFGRQFFLPPNSAANAFFLWTLRHLLIQDWDADDDGAPDTLRLMAATPRRWLEDEKTIQVRNAPTAFGEVSVAMTSRLSRGEIVAHVSAPAHPPARTLLRARVPDGWRVTSARAEGKPLDADPSGTVDISGLTGEFTVRFSVRS